MPVQIKLSQIRHQLLAVLLTLAILLTAVLGVLAQGGTTEVVGGDEASLRALLAQVADSYGPGKGRTVVEVGTLSSYLPFDLPLPADTTVLGSINHLRTDDAFHIQIIARSAQSPAAVREFYTTTLTTDPWQDLTATTNAGGSGFVGVEMESANLCYADEGMLSLSAYAEDDGATFITYSLQFDPVPDICRGVTPVEMSAVHLLLPRLTAPDGVSQNLNGSGGGGGTFGMTSAYSDATLTPTDADGSLPALAELQQHYMDQITAEGWTPVASETGEHLAWSAWTLTDENGLPWECTLNLIVSATDPNTIRAEVGVMTQPDA